VRSASPIERSGGHARDRFRHNDVSADAAAASGSLMGRNGKRGGVLLALALVAVAGAMWLYRDYRAFTTMPLHPLAAATTIDVPLGTSLPGVLRILDEHGIRTGNAWYWRVLARELGAARRLHAGEYALTPGLTPATLLQRMAAGEVVQHRFTIVEGWTFRQLRMALAQDDGLQHTLAATDDKDIMARLSQPGARPEGWFLPETYSYVKGMSDFDILRRANQAMRALLDTLWAGHPADFALDSPYQLLTLASIVEKETARADERPLIAAVFLHRLRIGMRLQTDPTVIYGLGASYDGNIRRRDLDTDTPYNTYTRAGLPPTPIALPGKAALRAVMHPAATDALYFVARGDGSHEFSATLELHNKAVARYQLRQSNR
jgi:peptidoglycan lytic transglycosylase G